MSQNLAILKAPPANIWHMYRAMVGLGVICGVLIVAGFLFTLPAIERNKQAALERAILRVLPDAKSIAAYRLAEGDRFEAAAAGRDERTIYAGYAADGKLAGLAIEAAAMGYADAIRVIYGYSSEQDAIIGFQVLESKETPGLGDKIETDPEFVANFKRLDVSLNAAAGALKNPIAFTKRGTKTAAWQVDGITGATISSKAIANMLNESAAFWVPKIRVRLDDFRKAATP